MYEYHDVPTAGHPGYSLLTRDFYWNHQYKWVRKYRVKPAPHSQAPLQPLPTPSECWESVSLDFVFGLPRDSRRKTGIMVFVDRFSKMVHLAAVAAEVTSVQTARLFVDMVLKHHGMPNDFVSDRDPRFTAHHPRTDGQNERVNRVLVALLKSYAQSFHN
ncbi:reverse transcriptase [Phytophthora megakarya]|uniref:Reverse transcriptase n=1 Tax=Phytophthora megakarya TaxID=4795 RepID=A0A225WKA0_9STRA|nr:reverse transcriptase [Phytophthora megakarya]